MAESTGTSKKSPHSVNRRTVLKLLGAAGVASVGAGPVTATGSKDAPTGFDPIEATASEIRSRYLTGQDTARSVIEQHLERIWEYEDELEAIITVNSNALDRAEELDEKLASDGPVGPLHGIPILLKDNNDTADMPTTAGSVALMDSIPPDDATIVRKMREAGGIILAKANLHEYAFGYNTISSLGGVTRNPYDLERYAGGSSGGTAAGIAASLGVLGTGTDTGGSVRVPAAATNLVGLRPSTGLISRDGIVPLSLTEDTAGPITRTVAEAALFTDVLAGYDPADEKTSESVRRTPHFKGKRYTDYLNETGLDGACIGVYREYVGPAEDEDNEDIIEDARQVEAVFDAALAELEDAGATIVDPVEAPPDELVELANVDTGDEFNRDINEYLQTLDDDIPDTLEEIVESGEYAPALCETIREREEVDEDAIDEDQEYLYGLSHRDDLQQFVLETMAANDLDAIVYPTIRQTPPRIDSDDPWGGNVQLTPALEFPSMTVPAGFTEESLPVSIEFMTRKFDEARLFELTYSYEQATQHRQAPAGFGPVEDPIDDWSSAMIEEWNEDQRRNMTVAETGQCE